MTLRYEHFDGDLGFEIGAYLKFKNLSECLPEIIRMRNGEINVVEGQDSTSFPEDLGTLIILDGKTRAEMEAQGAISREGDRLPFESFRGVPGAEKYIRDHYDDGAVFVDADNQKISLVGPVIPSREISLKTNTKYLAPPGFNVGCKAKAAMLLPLEYELVRTTRVSSTPRGSLKMGRVEGFGQEGLDIELELTEDPSRKEYAISPEFLGLDSRSTNPEVIAQLDLLRNVVPVLRAYENRDWENPVEKLMMVDRYGRMTTVSYDSKSQPRSKEIQTAKIPTNFRETCGGVLGQHEHPLHLEQAY